VDMAGSVSASYQFIVDKKSHKDNIITHVYIVVLLQSGKYT
jgi:hypothetical protein